MKKKSRFLTGLLSAVMALSLCAMPAMAEEAAEVAASVNPVWTQTTGSITIHKYEWNGTSGNPATGEADDTQLPSVGEGKDAKNPTPLQGATFEIYKVKDETWLKNYYSSSATETDKFDFTNWSNYAEKDGNAYKLKDGLTATDIQVTGTNGEAVFSNLELGLYLVIESKAPDSVTTACEPFFVSVPMTKVKDSKTNALSDWLYDVHVYPKNKTSYGNAVLQKIGKQSGNDTENANMKGYQFKLYKKQADGEWVWIEKLPANGADNAGTVIGEKGVLTTDANGKFEVSGLSNGVYAFVEIGVNEEDGYILDSGIAYVFKIENTAMTKATKDDVTDNKFPEGTSSFDFDSFNNDGTAKVKVENYKPDFKKEVTKRDNAANNNDADYAIGDDVPYTLTVNVPENVAKLKTFKVTDEMDSDKLICNNDIVVKAGDTTLAEGTDYTLTETTESGKSGFTVDFKANGKTTINAYAGKTITITYTAKLQVGASTEVAGNVNKADLIYSKKTDIAEGEEDTPYDIHDEAVVYTFKTGILKKGDDGALLSNVEFTLYKKYDEKTDTAYTVEGSVAGVIFAGEQKPFLSAAEAKKLGLNDTEESTDKWFAVTNLTTDSKGIATANGLPNGTYKLVETKTNEGYNLLSGPVDANLTIDYKTTWTTTTTFDASGKIVKHGEVKTTTFNDGNYTYTPITIINRKGFKLPVTGGFGTLLFSAIGVLLVVGGVGVLMSTKKKKGNA